MFLPRKGSAVAVILLAAAMAQCSRPYPQALNRYVDSSVCANCHAGVYKTYRNTGMARAFYSPAPGVFPNPKPYFHRASDTWFQITEKNGSFYQRSWQVGPSGLQESVGESKIDYVMGSGNHVRTFLHRTARNTLEELPLGWYAEDGGTWALNPGFDSAHPPAGRRVGYDCMFCHNAYPSIPAGHDDAGSEPVFGAALPEGVDCQRCHGPGQNHVRAAQAGKPNAKDSIVNPARLSAERAMDVCMQCHLETTSFPLPNAIRRFGRAPYSYDAGEPLSAFVLMYDHAPGTGNDDKFEIVSSAYRLRKSRCFLQSKGALTCISCHNPHDISHGAAAVEKYDAVCRRCHAQIAAVANHPQAGSCITCHMPKRRTEDVVHGVMTDHLIQRRPPAGNLLAAREEKHPNYRGEVVPYGDADPLYTAIAQVSEKSNAAAGIPRLEALLSSTQPARAEPYLEMGDAWRNTGQFTKAAAYYRQALSRRPGSALVLRRLADSLRGDGRQLEALDTLIKATQSEPDSAEAWYDLGLLQSDLGQRSQALDSLRKALQRDPELADAQNSLGAVLAESGEPGPAETAFRAALRLQPGLAAAHANLANLLSARNDLTEAVWHYEYGASTAQDQFNYAVTLARMNRLPAAQTHLEAALKQDSNLAEAHDLLGGILESEGHTDSALSHYREAVRCRPGFGKAHLDLGTLLATTHDRTGAAEEFRKAAEDPDATIRKQAASALETIARHE